MTTALTAHPWVFQLVVCPQSPSEAVLVILLSVLTQPQTRRGGLDVNQDTPNLLLVTVRTALPARQAFVRAMHSPGTHGQPFDSRGLPRNWMNPVDQMTLPALLVWAGPTILVQPLHLQITHGRVALLPWRRIQFGAGGVG